MRTFAIAAAFFAVNWSVAQEIDPTPGMCSHAKAALALHSPVDAGGPMLRGPGDTTDVLHYALDLDCDTVAHVVTGSNTMTVKSLADGLTSFTFQLTSEMSISSLQVDGAAAAYVRAAPNVTVTLPHAYDLNDQFDLRVAYSGTPASGLWFTTHGTAASPIVYTLSQPFDTARWFASKDDNADKATGDVWITVPSTMTVVANGVLQGVDSLPGSKSRYRWHTDYPTSPYLFCFSATNYNTYPLTFNYGGSSMPANFYLYPERDTTTERNRANTVITMLGTFSDKFGIYPYFNEKYGIYHFPFGGGMEHQTLTGQTNFSGNLSAHELTHQWWGDMVTCSTWHDIWLNEGFATYGEVVWIEFQPGSTGAAARISAVNSRRPTSFTGSVYKYDISNSNAIFDNNTTYLKGGWVLHMVRGIVGDTAFFNILSTWRQLYQYDGATTPDFQAVCEAVSGQTMEWFFTPWVYGIGAPSYRSSFRNVTVGSKTFIEIYFEQLLSTGYPTFTMPVQIRLSLTAGGTQTVTVWNDALSEHFLIPSSGAVSSITVDPDSWVLTVSKTTGTFAEGPPKIIDVVPTPASHISGLGAASLTVQFHKDVTIPAGAVTLAGAHFGAIPLTVNYNAAALTATLTPDRVLRPDTYTLTIGDTIRDVAASLALDGEIVAGAFPSGNGQAGGAGVTTFVVGPAGDLDGDGDVDESDLGILLQAWQTNSDGDLNGDGVTNEADLGLLLGSWGQNTP
ncbi:MAG: M1 family aminopeptidase [Phycisphaerae bacterium]